MDIVFVAINAKYIHTSPAVRLLNECVDRSFDSKYLEFAIKDKIERMLEKILSHKPLIVGFSCYIWNIHIVLELARKLKEINKDIIILLGGPEVSYDIKSFISLPYIDYIASGEGETLINPFIKAIKNKEKIDFKSIASKEKFDVTPNVVKDLKDIPSIIHTYTKDDFENRIIYYECSRGCPFACEYCLSSLESGVRVIPLEQIYSDLTYLIENKAKTIKFLDRTFNFNKVRFLELIKFLEKVGQGHTFQFEITLDLFDEELLDYFENKVTPDMFRFEIGIQSIHDKVNQAVSRKQDTEKLLKSVERLINGKRVTLHLDLIVGLPYETYDMAVSSFETVFKVFPHELQLGFLKLLRGTSIRENASKHGYVYKSEPPYELISNDYMSEEEVEKFILAEEALEVYFNKNRAREIFIYLIENDKIDSSFELFYNLGIKLSETKISDAYDYYKILIDVIKKMGYFDKRVSDLFLYCYLTKYPIRPKLRSNIRLERSVVREHLGKYNKEIKPNTYIFMVNYQDGYLVLCYLTNKILYYYLEVNGDEFKHELIKVKLIKGV